LRVRVAISHALIPTNIHRSGCELRERGQGQGRQQHPKSRQEK
jgi:hypothetical protein